MSWSKEFMRTTTQRPYDSVLFCGICGLEVHVTRADELITEGEVEDFAVTHLDLFHPFRYWLWKKLRWRWLVAGLAS